MTDRQYLNTSFGSGWRVLFKFTLMMTVTVVVGAQPDTSIFDKFQPHTIVVDGYNINVEVLGDGDPIFFFAGGPGNSHDYMQGNFGHYYQSHKVVFIDMLGRGLSDDARDKSEYSIDQDVHVAESVRRALGLGKVSLVGHSYGTVVAQAYAVSYPENVHKMVLINGFHSGEMWQANCDSYNHYCRTHFPEKWKKVDSLRALGYISMDKELNSVYWSIPSKYVYYHDTDLKQRSPKYEHRAMNLDVYFAIIGPDAEFFVSGSMMDTDFRRDLADLDIPTLIIAGRYDGVSTPEYAVQYITFMPQAQFVMFEKSGHNPYLEEPEKFYNLIDTFFEIEK
jgi:proline iminopeptidase